MAELKIVEECKYIRIIPSKSQCRKGQSKFSLKLIRNAEEKFIRGKTESMKNCEYEPYRNVYLDSRSTHNL